MSARKTLTLYVLLVLAETVVYYRFPGLHVFTWAAIGLTGAGAVVVGVRVHRPRHPYPWYMLAASLTMLMCGDTIYNLLVQLLHENNPFVSPADVSYLAMYPVLAFALTGFIRYSQTGRDRGSMLDALTVTSGVGLLSWIFLINPYVRDHHLTVVEKATSIAYPLGDVLILVTFARLLAGVKRNRAMDWLGVGIVGLLVADVLYGLRQLAGSWTVGGPVDLAWVVFYSACGAAALHPSMTRLTLPDKRRTSGEVSNRRLVLLAAASLIAPATLLVESATAKARDVPVIAVLSATTFLLVLTRLAGMVARHRQAVARERALRDAAAALLSATDADKVRDGLRAAVAQLLRDGTPHVMALLIGAANEPADLRRQTRLVPVDTLPGLIRGQVPGFRTVLVVPLVLGERRGAAPYLGQLLIAAAERQLRSLDGAVEVLASQAALAMERITLTDEVNRRNSEAYFRTLVHNTSDVILILDDSGRVRYASPSIDTMLGVESLSGVEMSTLIHPQWRMEAATLLTRIRSGVMPTGVADWNVLHSDGSRIQVEVTCRDLRGDPTVGGLVLTLRDVTERRQLENELTHRAFHDALTGLANRILFQERVTHALSVRQRGHGGQVAVLFIDLDDFKVINDTMGHGVGDELLVAVAQRLSGALRGHDTAARLGGDEFAALIEDVTDPAEIDTIAERVVRALAEPFLVGPDGAVVNTAASVGIATTDDADNASDLLRQADLALYVAKADGKGLWRRYRPEFHAAMKERMEIRSDLEKAVQDNSFEVHYQPIVDLETGTAAGFEALIRWRHPTRGLVSPGTFIEIAEETGLILPIGAWVLEEALASAARWQCLDTQRNAPYVSVNVSVRQFREPGFVERVRAALTRTGAPAGSVLLEITESLLLRSDDTIFEDLTALRRLGVRIAIDDFGTGYSSLSYLRQFPIDVLKIDKSFIDDIGSPQQRALVDAIVRLAETLNLKVIAEGVETEAQREVLARMGCPHGQGYLFSRPLPLSEAVGWLPVTDPASPTPVSSTGSTERNEVASLT
jgi:diguanylate cyclase (GGDEF)-like protein/PAS domain S-box-containing protein